MNRKHAAPLLLGLFYLAQALQIGWFLRADSTQPFLQWARTYEQGRGQLELLFAPMGPAEKIHAICSSTLPWPPLGSLAGVPFHLLLGPRPAVGALQNLGWLALLLWSVYRLAESYAGAEIGLFAAVLTGAFPMVLGHRMMILPFLAEAACAAACAAALIRGRGFTAGLWAGLGLLLRWDCAVYLVALVLGLIWSGRIGRRELARCVAGALLVAGWWYLLYFGHTLRFYRGEGLFSAKVVNEEIDLFSLENLLFYPRRLGWRMLGPPLALAAAAGLLRGLVRELPEARLALCWIGLPWIFYLLLPMKEGKYLLPMAPAFALAAAGAVDCLPRLRRGLVAAALAQIVLVVHLPGAAALWPPLRDTPETWHGELPAWQDAQDQGLLRPWRDTSWRDCIEQLDRAMGPRTPERVRVHVAPEAFFYLQPLHWTRAADLFLLDDPGRESARFLVVERGAPRTGLRRLTGARLPDGTRIELLER